MNKEKLIGLTYLILLSAVGFVNPSTTFSAAVIDIVGLQWYYLSYLNLFFFIFIIFRKFKVKSVSGVKPFLANPLNKMYFLFFLMCGFSFIFSINHAVSLIAISKIFITLSSLFIINELQISKYLKIEHIAIVFSVYLVVEVWASLRQYFDIIKVTDFNFKMAASYLKGITGNKNITSASIAFKIPFLFLLIFQIKKKYFLIPLLFFTTVAYFNLILLSSRAIILSITLCSIFFVIGSLISTLRTGSNFKLFFYRISLFLLPIIVSSIYAYNVITDESIKIENRVSTINATDVGTSTRIRYYEKGINYFLENPFFGSGIGNFQLIGIQLDSQNIESYVVPYVAHNDFIELLTETGIIGVLFYLAYILLTLFFLVTIFFKSSDEKIHGKVIILTLPFIVYFIDSNLNFPLYRPIMQGSMIVYIILVYSIYNRLITERKEL